MVFFAFVLYTQGKPLALGSASTPGIYFSALQLWSEDVFWATFFVLIVVAMLPDYLLGYVSACLLRV